MDPELAEVCQREHVHLVGLLALDVGDRAVAEELAEQVLVRLHQHWPQVRASESPRAWLAAAALGLARSRWRRRAAERRARRRRDPAERDEDGSRPNAGEPSAVLAIRSVVSELPDGERAVVLLRSYAGLSVDEAAHALGCTTATVRSLTSSAINVLRLSIDDLDDMIELEKASDA